MRGLELCAKEIGDEFKKTLQTCSPIICGIARIFSPQGRAIYWIVRSRDIVRFHASSGGWILSIIGGGFGSGGSQPTRVFARCKFVKSS